MNWSLVSNVFSDISTDEITMEKEYTYNSRFKSASHCGRGVVAVAYAKWEKYNYKRRDREKVEKVERLEVGKIRRKIPNEGFRVA